MAKKKDKKADNDALAKGAADIKNAEAQKPIVIPEAKRSIQEVLKDRVTVLPGSLGIKMAEDTPIEETFQVLDYTNQMKEHVGFMLGDIINFGNTKFGETYKIALNQTGRAYSTLAGYAETARRIPFEKRIAALPFSHHRELIRLPDEKMAEALKEVGEQVAKGKEITKNEIRTKVQKLTPRKRAKRVTSGKGKKKSKEKELPPYVPTDEEQSKLDGAESLIGEASDTIKKDKLFSILGKLDNKEKRRWLTLMEPIVTLYNSVDRVTGY